MCARKYVRLGACMHAFVHVCVSAYVCASLCILYCNHERSMKHAYIRGCARKCACVRLQHEVHIIKTVSLPCIRG